jgi:hypothetical protein
MPQRKNPSAPLVVPIPAFKVTQLMADRLSTVGGSLYALGRQEGSGGVPNLLRYVLERGLTAIEQEIEPELALLDLALLADRDETN